jgi:hypothetical protein
LGHYEENPAGVPEISGKILPLLLAGGHGYSGSADSEECETKLPKSLTQVHHKIYQNG